MELHAFEILAQDAEQNSDDFREAPCTLQNQPQQIFPDVTPPGMAYVPYQLWSDTIYDSQTGMQQGTIFPVLDFPFSPVGGNCS